MKELSQHIEALLLKHDCVIVPGLGGFVTQYVPARRVVEENIFLPPYRSVGFNQQLVLNDGLLVQSFMLTAGVDYAEACQLVDAEVAAVKQTLLSEGEYELPGIGTLKLGANGAYDFAPCEAGVLSPELYGLDALSIKPVAETQVAVSAPANASVQPKAKALHVKRTERDYTIRISRELVNYAAVIAIACICYFVWATPVHSTADGNRQAAALVYEQLFDMAHDAATQPAKETTVQAKDVQSVAQNVQAAAVVPTTTAPASLTEQPQKMAEPDKQTTPTVQPEQGYTLVLASAVPRKSAEAYVARLRKAGYSARVYSNGRMVRVVYGQYATKAEAQGALKGLRAGNRQFADAWVLSR